MGPTDKENMNTPTSSQFRKKCYRELLNKVEVIQETDDLGINTVNEIGNILREANNLDSQVKIDNRIEHADETLLDCLVLSSASTVLKKCIESVDVFTSTYEASEFVGKLINIVRDDNQDEEETSIQPTDLLKLLESARSIIPNVPDYLHIPTLDLGPPPEPKQKKERAKPIKENLQKKAPEKVVSLEKEEQGIEEIVKILHDVLQSEYDKNKEEAIKYYDYIIDTDSFSTTVENMFYCSFLLRDGRAEIDLDKKGEPLIKPVKKRNLKQFRDKGGVNAQIIPCITVEEWEKHSKPGYLQIYKQSIAKE